MALSILTKQPENFGSQGGSVGTLQLDSSYVTGGYSVTPSMFSLSAINSLVATTTGGYDLIYNYSTQKLMVFTSSGGGAGNTGATSAGTPAGSVSLSPITEAVAIAGNTGTLAFAPAAITSIYATAAGTPGPLTVIPSAQTPASGEISVNLGTGVLTTFAGDGVTAVSVVYINTGGTFTGSELGTHTHTIAASGGGNVQVSNGTNLSTVTANFIVIGQ